MLCVASEPDTIDWRVANYKKGGGLNQFKIIENHLVNIAAAKVIGLCICNVSAEDDSINLKSHPKLIRLLQDGEDLHDLLASAPGETLKRWLNYHLAKKIIQNVLIIVHLMWQMVKCIQYY